VRGLSFHRFASSIWFKQVASIFATFRRGQPEADQVTFCRLPYRWVLPFHLYELAHKVTDRPGRHSAGKWVRFQPALTPTDARPTYGYRRVTALLNRARRMGGVPQINHKRASIQCSFSPIPAADHHACPQS
jgi:hypothetical protein